MLASASLKRGLKGRSAARIAASSSETPLLDNDDDAGNDDGPLFAGDETSHASRISEIFLGSLSKAPMPLEVTYETLPCSWQGMNPLRSIGRPLTMASAMVPGPGC